MTIESTGEQEAQAAPASQPQAGTSSTSQAEGSQTAQAASAAAESGTENLIMSADEAAKLRKEHNSLRKRLADYEKREAEAEQAKLSEIEKANRRVEALEQQIADFRARDQEHRVRLATVEVATRLGFRSPDLAYRVLDRSQLEFDEQGAPKNVEKLLKALLESDPYLGKGTTGDFGGGSRGVTPSNQPTMNELLRAAARD